MDNDSTHILNSIKVHLNEVLQVSQRPPLDRLTPALKLRQDLGLDSLELAELTVRLEAEFGVDIFRDGLISSVGDVVESLKSR